MGRMSWGSTVLHRSRGSARPAILQIGQSSLAINVCHVGSFRADFSDKRFGRSWRRRPRDVNPTTQASYLTALWYGVRPVSATSCLVSPLGVGEASRGSAGRTPWSDRLVRPHLGSRRDRPPRSSVDSEGSGAFVCHCFRDREPLGLGDVRGV